MLIHNLPRLILATMFLSIVALGYCVKMNQTRVTFVASAASFTVAERS